MRHVHAFIATGTAALLIGVAGCARAQQPAHMEGEHQEHTPPSTNANTMSTAPEPNSLASTPHPVEPPPLTGGGTTAHGQTADRAGGPAERGGEAGRPRVRHSATTPMVVAPEVPTDADPSANRLIHEKSPYLLQHAYNPVHWFPWGAEAFATAKQADKPVFLSIGYSTCYWCHVMEQESFDNPGVAALMNDTVVAIKVDREERPDIDALYMSAVQGLTGQGGWPLTVFLTPDGEPFWGGTYFPPEDRFGRPGMTTTLRSIAEAWRTKRQDILRSSQSITRAIQAELRVEQTTPLSADTLAAGVAQFTAQYDATFGGFGPAPKFPRSHGLSFLLRGWYRSRDPEVLKMVERTLEAMACGGIHDHIGGGFHRYATDQEWLVPHFEKMLYDQALLARTYVEAYQITKRPRYAEVAHDIFAYVLRDLRDAGGAFYSAEDAGKVGQEGAFYVWTPQELDELLGQETATLFNQFYHVTPGGNFEHGTTILTSPETLEAFAARFGRPVAAVHAHLDAARARVLEARNRRARPHRDDKILTDWNGLMIGALAYGAQGLQEPRYAQAAKEAATFLMDELESTGQLLHRYRDGDASIPAFLEDYAFLSGGLLDLYTATGETRWLAEAIRLTKTMVQLFWDEQAGGFFLTSATHDPLIAKTKPLYDGAHPSGNSAAALILVRLAQLTMDPELTQSVERQMNALSGPVSQAPHAFPHFLIALDSWLGPSQEIVIAGSPQAPQTQAMLQVIRNRFLPRAVFAFQPADDTAPQIEAILPFLAHQRPLQGKSTAYVCERHLCKLPTTNVDTLAELLDAIR